MGILGDSDIAAMLADLLAADGGVVVTLGGDTTAGLLDREAREIFGDEMAPLMTNERVLAVKTGTLSGLAPDANLTLDGDDYTVRRHFLIGDGGLTVIVVRERPPSP